MLEIKEQDVKALAMLVKPQMLRQLRACRTAESVTEMHFFGKCTHF